MKKAEFNTEVAQEMGKRIREIESLRNAILFDNIDSIDEGIGTCLHDGMSPTIAYHHYAICLTQLENAQHELELALLHYQD